MLRTKILLGYAIPIGVALVASLIIHRALLLNIATSERVIHTTQVIATAKRLANAMLEAETSERGFLLTGDEAFLVPYYEAQAKFRQTSPELKHLVTDNPEQVARLERVEALFTQWRTQTAEPEIAARRAAPPRLAPVAHDVLGALLQMRHAEAAYLYEGRADDLRRWRSAVSTLRTHAAAMLAAENVPAHARAWQRVLALTTDYERAYLEAVNIQAETGRTSLDDRQASFRAHGATLERLVQQAVQRNRSRDAKVATLVAAGANQALITELRQAMEAFVSAEREALVQRMAANRAATRWGQTVALAGIGLALVLTMLIGPLLWVGIIRSVQSMVRAAQGLANGDLSQRTVVHSHDELGMLARAFNTMAERLALMMKAEQHAKAALVQQVNDLVEQRTKEADLTNQLGELLQACTSVQEAYSVIAHFTGHLFPEETGAVFVCSHSRDLVEAVATWGAATANLAGTGFAPDACWGLRCGQAHVVVDPQTAVQCQHLQHPLPAAYVCVPLIAQGETLGLLYVSSAAPAQAGSACLSASKRRLAETVAKQIALALANLRLRESLQFQSIRDALTGLFNRRYMEETMQRELQRAERKHRALGVIMVDVDHFKQFNDRFGHDAGDAVLRVLGSLLQRRFRGDDIVCRYGGEEFVLILPEASLEATRRRAEELRAAAQQLQVVHHRQALGRITLSVGVAAYPEHGRTSEALLQAADEALYRAKGAGRNQVHVAEGVAEVDMLPAEEHQSLS